MRVCLLVLLVACAHPQAAKPKTPATLVAGMPEGEAGKQLSKAVQLMDAGKLTEAAEILEKLHREHPDNGLILHELGLTYRLLKQPQKAIALLTPFRAALPVESLAGLAAAHDEAGENAKAQEILREAVKRHPTSGLLHSELGTTLLAAGKPAEALVLYEKAMQIDPPFPASYLRAAEILAKTPNRGMALLYGETFRLLEPSGKRSGAAAELMVQVSKEAVTLGSGKSKGTANIKLADSRIEVKNANDGLPIANELELAFGPGLALAHMSGLSLKSLHAARRGLVDALNGPAKSSSLAAMPIMRWLRALAAAGHLEAYNYWLYGPAMEDEAVAWFDAHQKEAEAMAEYIVQHPLFP